jgi:large subunit ribosomal protein L29
MKSKELNKLNEEQLTERLGEELEAFNRLKFSHALSPIENPMRIREARRTIAQLHTAIRAKQLNK